MFVHIEETPNPSTMKFIPEAPVASSGINVDSSASAQKFPLAKAIFEVDGVRSVYFGEDFIAVTIKDYDLWANIKPQIIARVIEYFDGGGAIVNASAKKEPISNYVPKEEDKELVEEIISLIDERIRPAVAMDGGDIVFHSYNDGVVYLMLQGACSGCPSASFTLKNGIENMLKYYFPDEIKEVVEVTPDE